MAGFEAEQKHSARQANREIVDAPLTGITVAGEDFVLLGGPGASFHGHLRIDDGMGTVDSQAEKAKEGNVPFFGDSPHNHDKGREGVPPEDPRYKDEQGVTIVAKNPDAFFEMRNDAKRVTKEGKVIVYTGEEMGTISKTNHMILLESDTFCIADLKNLAGNKTSRFLSAKDRLAVESGEKKVIRYTVDNGKELLDKLRQVTETQIIMLACHPKKVDEKQDGKQKNLPPGVNPSDYFLNNYRNMREWAEKLARPYMFGMGVIQGRGLTKEKLDYMPPSSLELKPILGYMDGGAKPAMLFERDHHYGDPGGRPAGMLLLIPKSQGADYTNEEKKAKGLEALLQKRSSVSTMYDDLQAVTIANDKYVMGSTINPKDIDSLKFKVLIGGKIDLNATYRVKLWADTTLGDNQAAQIVDEKALSGRDLLKAHQYIEFDEVDYRAKNGNSFVMEVERLTKGDNGRDEVDVRAATTAIWVEPESKNLNFLKRRSKRISRANEAPRRFGAKH